MLQIENLNAHYGGRAVLSDLSLRLERGCIHALVGPSGCGKSTLLKILCGIHRNYSGNLLFDNRPLYEACTSINIGYVPQNYGLLPWKTIRKNIFLPFELRGGRNNRLALKKSSGKGDCDGPHTASASVSAKERAGCVADYAEQLVTSLGLADVLNRHPREVSGGQQQRAALARAFLLQPDLLLMDEPFSALDAFTADKSQQLFLALWRDFRVTTLFITHNMREAALLGQRILLMAGNPGRIVASLDNPAFEAAYDDRTHGSVMWGATGYDAEKFTESIDGEEQRSQLVAKMSAFFAENMS